jgi:ABC-type bacteriocin/lantibiotic exporter with double-glycine peptidase domain
LRSPRGHIGVVPQNGRLFGEDIFSNITISAPTLNMDEAWEAAETAGIAEDIRAMPMGMRTMISEGSGGISGGQRQRIIIARAIAAKPRILSDKIVVMDNVKIVEEGSYDELTERGGVFAELIKRQTLDDNGTTTGR